MYYSEMGQYKPSSGMQSAARRGLDLVRQGRAGGGFEPATATRARKIASGAPLSRDHVMRMHSFFSRHAVDRKPNWGAAGKETPGYVAWQACGGDAGAAWAARQAASIKRSESGK